MYGSLLGGRGGPTLLDGELLQRGDDAGRGTGAKAVYMAFDAVAVHGAPTGKQPLSSRLDALGTAMRNPFKDADGEEGGTLPLDLMGKLFLPAAQGGSGLRCLRSSGGAHPPPLLAPLESAPEGAPPPHRVFTAGIRVNATDGLVFTPMHATYREQFNSGSPTCPAPLLKWKFADEQTVDFKLKRGDLEPGGGGGAHPIKMYLSGGRDSRGGDVDVFVTRVPLSLPAVDGYAALLDSRGMDEVIVEAGYDVGASAWVLKRVRDRKTRANHVLTGWATLEVAAEGINEAELVRVLGKGGAQ